jgi:hypothetical protein
VKVTTLVPILAVLACGCDSRAPAPGAGASSSTAAAASRDCAGLGAHWREVWTGEGRPGLERRARRAGELAAAAWARGCAEVAATPPSAADLERMQAIKSFAALEAMDATASKGALAALLRTAQDSALKTKRAFAAAPSSGVVEFCGDDVDRASVKSAAKGKDDGACAALQVLLAKKCAR